jgi:transcriptional regulator with XRE-family HTH domain
MAPGDRRRRLPLEVAFGRTLRRLREDLGVSQEHLAHTSGIYRTHIGMMERGERRPSLATVFRLAGALGIKPSELLQRFEDRVATPD